MRRIEISAYDLAQRFIGLTEVSGPLFNPQILAMLRLDGSWPEDDSVPWCSAFVNYIAWMLRLPRSRSLKARSWLGIGEIIQIENAEPGFDIVIFSRGSGSQPGPEVLDAPGHVGFYAGMDGEDIMVLGGNQNDRVSISVRPKSRMIGIRRLY